MPSFPALFLLSTLGCGDAPPTAAPASGEPAASYASGAPAAAAGPERGKAAGDRGKGPRGKAGGGPRGGGTTTCTPVDLDAHLPAVGPWLTYDPDGSLALHFLTHPAGPATVRVEWEGGELDLQSKGDDGLHHLRLAGAPAGTPLRYTITDGAGRASSTFTTHRVAPTATELTVLAAADMQDDGRDVHRWAQVAAGMRKVAPDADLMVLPGDLAADDLTDCWWLFFDRARDLFATVPLVVAVGNHDTPGRSSSPDSSSVRRLFDPRGDGPGPEIGVVEVGPLRVLLLNSELPDSWAVDGAQYRWAEQALAAPTDATHTIAAFHRPAYDVGARFAGEQHLFRDLTQLFDGRVSLVLMGHEHIYQRFLPIQYQARPAPAYGVEAGDGVAYMVLPAAGNNGLFNSLIGPADPQAALRQLVAAPDLSGGGTRVDQWHGFAQLELSGSSLAVTTWRVGDAVTVEERFQIAD